MVNWNKFIIFKKTHVSSSYFFNQPAKPYDQMIFLYATGDAKKARYHLVRLTKTCDQLVRTHMKYKSDLLPSGDI